MATAQMNRVRTIKKSEKPRLKFQRNTTVDGRITTIEEIVSLMDNVAMLLNSGNNDQTNVIAMCNQLKLHAPQIEAIYKDQVDRAFVAIRNGSQDERFDLTTRVHLLELIELRAKQWHHNDSMDSYYSQKLMNLDSSELLTPDTPTSLLSSTLLPASVSPPLLGPGDVLKNSGKFAKPTRIPGKNYCKDEVVIRNSDSGKVMGIKGRRVHMIEELSETIISFQRVNPGARERLVQITGTSEDKILYAKDLIKDTIQRNASPVRLEQSGEKSGIGGSSSSLNSSASDESNRIQQQSSQFLRNSLLQSSITNDASFGEYKYTVTIGNQSLKITGNNLELVRTAKLVLDSYFEQENANSGTKFFSLDEEPLYMTVPSQPQIPVIPVLSQPQIPMIPVISSHPQIPVIPMLGNLTNLQSFNGTVTGDEGFKIKLEEPTKTHSVIKLSYDFLLACSKGPYAKRPPVDWARIQKEVPAIVGKTPIRWFEPEAYKAKVAAAGFVTVLPTGESENDLD